jgi:undecaprenyl-diphosphatase
MIEKLKSIDTYLLLAVNSRHCDWLDTVMWHITGNLIWVPFYLALLAAIIYKYRWKFWIVLLGVALTILIADQVASGIIKPLVERLRPSHEPSLAGMLHLVRGYAGGQFGFVSSHAANTFGVAVFIIQIFRNRIFTISILIWASIVSFSRIYLGVHYPCDVICGALVGVLAGLCVGYFTHKALLLKNIFKQEEKNKRFIQY